MLRFTLKLNVYALYSGLYTPLPSRVGGDKNKGFGYEEGNQRVEYPNEDKYGRYYTIGSAKEYSLVTTTLLLGSGSKGDEVL